MSVSVTTRSYAEAQRLRRKLIEVHGIDGWRVTSTPNDELDRLLPVQLTLVPDLDEPARALGVSDDTEDEAASTRYFLQRASSGFTKPVPYSYPTLGGDAA